LAIRPQSEIDPRSIADLAAVQSKLRLASAWPRSPDIGRRLVREFGKLFEEERIPTVRYGEDIQCAGRLVCSRVSGVRRVARQPRNTP
jgi:hypothetical protein